MTHPQQSTAEAIFRLVSSPKRQAMQGKSLSCRRYTLELLPTCENIGLQSHLGPRNSQAHSSAPQETPSHTPDAPPMRPQPCPRHFPRRAPLRTHTPPSPQPHPTPKSHVIPPGPRSLAARKPRNINDLISKPETPSGELRAKLLSTCHGGTSRSPPRGLDTHTRATCAAGVEGAGRARTRTHARLEAAAGPAGPGRGAGGWRQGLAGL